MKGKKKGKKKSVKKASAVKRAYTPKEYTLTMRFNGETNRIRTDDLDSAILAFKPIFLKTKIFMKIRRKDKAVYEKVIFPMQGRLLFMNKMSRQVFLNRLIFKLNG